MGSEKYKGENTFDSFLSKHGGSSNASTDYEKVLVDAMNLMLHVVCIHAFHSLDSVSAHFFCVI